MAAAMTAADSSSGACRGSITRSTVPAMGCGAVLVHTVFAALGQLLYVAAVRMPFKAPQA
jgi:hypothetical protein